MHILTPIEFLAKFPTGQRVAFVGNAPSLRGEKLGVWIDSHYIAVRFNGSPASEHILDQGARKDILLSNPYRTHRRAQNLCEGGAFVVIHPQIRRSPTPEFEAWVGPRPVLFTYVPDIVQDGDIEHMTSLTTGVCGLHLLSRIAAALEHINHWLHALLSRYRPSL